MYGLTLNTGRKNFCYHCFQAFSTSEILKIDVNDYFKINGEQIVQMSKKGEYVRFKNYGNKIKSFFMVYAYFQSNLVAEDNVKLNRHESYTNKFLVVIIIN